MVELPDHHAAHYFLTAGETDAQGLMPMTLIIARCIEAATEHANILGIGYDALKEHGIGWVLARISVEMQRYPKINERYSLTTWIEGLNRLYSDRCFELCDAEGHAIGHIRSMWIAIDMEQRTAADLTVLDLSRFLISDRRCPVPKPRKLPPLTDPKETEYTFRYTDIDFNRHVNTVQYVRVILNQWSMQFFDTHRITHFDMAFHQECHYADTVAVKVSEDGPEARCEIVKSDGTRAVAASMRVMENEK